MMSSEQQQHEALDRYVTFCARVYDASFQALKKRHYPVVDCRHFATLMIMQTMEMSTTQPDLTEAQLKAYMQAMTPGGQA